VCETERERKEERKKKEERKEGRKKKKRELENLLNYVRWEVFIGNCVLFTVISYEFYKMPET
jgi:hypothetical protein